jgi:hypothetical protein
MYFLTYDNDIWNDGFGAQIQRILSIYILSKIFNLNYFHSNIILNRNIDGLSLKDITDESYLEKFNNLFIELNNNSIIEFNEEIRMNVFDIDQINLIISKQIDFNVLIRICGCHDYIDNNSTILDKFIPHSLSWIDSKLNEHLNIAVHIRRGDVSTQHVDRYVYIDFYIDIINNLTNILSGYLFEYNIYCDSITSDEMNELIMKCSTSKMTFHINTDVIQTFMAFVNCDILIAGKSSFSYAASFLRQKGIILYIPIRHAYSEKHLRLDSANSIIINKEKIYKQLKIAHY